MTEHEWDKKLNINTIGRDASKEDLHHYPYEPTPYSVLQRLAESEYICRENCLVDYGCGRGRVSFFLKAQLGCRSVGIDYDDRMCVYAQENLTSFGDAGGILFIYESAEKYEIEDGDRFYFFNPFSVEILKSVMGKIKASYYEQPREMCLFFYYPSDEYISYLMTVPELCFMDEIDCSDLFEGNNSRERIVIFQMM